MKVELLKTLSSHKDCIYSLSKVNDSGFLTAGGDGYVVEWNLDDLNTGKLLCTFPNAIYSCININDDLFAVGLSNGGLFILSRKARKPLHSYPKKYGIFCFYIDGSSLFVGGESGNLFKIDLSTFKEVSHQKIGSKNLRQVKSFSKDSLVLASSEGITYFVDKESLEIKTSYKSNEIATFSIEKNLKSNHLISGGRDAQIYIHQSSTPNELFLKIPAHMFTVNDLKLHPALPILVSASRDNTIKLWDSESYELLKVLDSEKLDGHNHSVNSIEWMKDQRLISVSDDKQIKIWSLT